MSRFQLKTGDILLFDINESGLLGLFNKAIKYFTNSHFSHVAMVLKDPIFINKNLKGYYIWESSWEGEADPQDNKVKLGVQITPFEEIYNKCVINNSSIFVRRIQECDNNFCNENLRKIHDIVYNKPYDTNISDWISALLKKDNNPQKTNRFWCSALVGYIYTKCNLLIENTDWSILRPSDFSIEYPENLKWVSTNKFEDKQEQIL